jgi:ethanolaminephosphotransferase
MIGAPWFCIILALITLAISLAQEGEFIHTKLHNTINLSSPNMVPKQKEMDDIVKKIYSAITKYPHLSDTLLVLAGDHGMNDAGNHGGSAPGETSPALVFISPMLKDISKRQISPLPVQDNFQYYSTVEQSDIAPTLAALLDFPIPKNNLGAFITEFLPFWTDSMLPYMDDLDFD